MGMPMCYYCWSVSVDRQSAGQWLVSDKHLNPAAKQQQVVTPAHQRQSSVQRRTENTEIDTFGHISGGTLQQSQPGPWSKLTGDPATKPRGIEKSKHDATA